jgi:hypothetical protein
VIGDRKGLSELSSDAKEAGKHNVAFLGMFLLGKSWHTMLQAYTFTNGNIWPLVLLVTGAAPYMAAKFRGLI